MPTQHIFDSVYSSNGSAGFSSNSDNVTITATSDDGVISVNDSVIFTGTSSVNFNTGVSSGDTLYYHGTGTFDGEVGYVFSVNAVLSLPGPVIVLTDNPENFTLPNDVHAFATNASPQTLGTDPACFAAGTLIATPRGDCRVEALRIGDLVMTDAGHAVPVKWIGHQTANKVFAGLQMQPVRIQAGALGDGLPQSDLIVTADHGMILDDLVINASALVNGSAIDFVPMDELEDSFTVFHIETEDHDVILANGAAAETFVDAVTRGHFDNYQKYLDIYGAERIIPEMDRPRISTQRLLPDAIKAKLGIAEHSDSIDILRQA